MQVSRAAPQEAMNGRSQEFPRGYEIVGIKDKKKGMTSFTLDVLL